MAKYMNIERNKLDYILTDIMPVEVSELFSYGKFYEFLLDHQKELNNIIGEMLKLKAKGEILFLDGNWKDKKNYLTFYELRETFGYTYECNRNCYKITGHINSNNDFFIYCEMILNIVQNVIPKEEYQYLEETMKQILEIICYDLEVLNCKICTKSDGKLIIGQKDAAVTDVVDIVEPNLADSILEYNHYVLRSNMEEKNQFC